MSTRIAAVCLVFSLFSLSTSALAESVRFRLDATNASGEVVDTVRVGETFFLNAYTQDIGTDRTEGVFAAYLDVLIEPTLASVVGPVQPGSDYENASDNGVASAGLLNNFGGFAESLLPLGADELLVFSQEMQADALGTIEFTSAFANESPAFDVLVYGTADPVLAADIEFGTLSLQVAEVPEPESMTLLCVGGLAWMLFRRKR